MTAVRSLISTSVQILPLPTLPASMPIQVSWICVDQNSPHAAIDAVDYAELHETVRHAKLVHQSCGHRLVGICEFQEEILPELARVIINSMILDHEDVRYCGRPSWVEEATFYDRSPDRLSCDYLAIGERLRCNGPAKGLYFLSCKNGEEQITSSVHPDNLCWKRFLVTFELLGKDLFLV